MKRYCRSDSELGWEWMAEVETPRAMEVVKWCVDRFGPANVFILSKCSGGMRGRMETWLFRTMSVCGEEIGMVRGYVKFCRERSGLEGKGRVARDLHLSHFVDDKDECLWSVYEEGDSQACVETHGGRLFHMANGADGRRAPRPRTWPARDRPACVTPVRNWHEVLRYLSRAPPPGTGPRHGTPIRALV